MKIITWNVNGIRALARKGGLDWIRDQQADVICLQEVKASQEQIDQDELVKFTGYDIYWHPAARPGYSGVVTFSRHKPTEFRCGLGAGRFDHEGRVIQTQFRDTILFNIYFPNGKRDHTRLAYKLDFYAHLLEKCNQMHTQGAKIILCGDFNTAHKEIDLANPKENANTSGFLPEERAWIDRYLENGFLDIYRQLYPDRVQYTWWTYRFGARSRNIGWRLDYFLLSEALVSSVRNVTVHDQILGSDHCPVSLTIDLEE